MIVPHVIGASPLLLVLEVAIRKKFRSCPADTLWIEEDCAVHIQRR